MVSTKCKLLIKEPADGYKPDHVLRVNNSFASQTLKVRVPAAIHKTSEAERDKSNESIQEVCFLGVRFRFSSFSKSDFFFVGS
jgi:hypothetical protein